MLHAQPKVIKDAAGWKEDKSKSSHCGWAPEGRMKAATREAVKMAKTIKKALFHYLIIFGGFYQSDNKRFTIFIFQLLDTLVSSHCRLKLL